MFSISCIVVSYWRVPSMVAQTDASCRPAPSPPRPASSGQIANAGEPSSRPSRPIVVGAPWLDHPRNQEGAAAIWFGHDYGEILPEDIAEFARMKESVVASADEWMSVMEKVPEAYVKASIASLLKEPAKSDWGGEENDHYSANVTVSDKRCTAAFLLKGPAKFQEMTPAMCGKNGDQIYRLTKTGADISTVQHAHLIGPAVRETLRSMVVTPGRPRKFCVMDGQATYRLLKAYGLLPAQMAGATV